MDRVFSSPDISPEDEINWVTRPVRITNATNGEVVYAMDDVEVPDFFSDTATTILAQKYMYQGTGIDDPAREHSLKQVVRRITRTQAAWAIEQGHISDKDGPIFEDELAYMLYHQYGAYNSPVWFNIGHAHLPQVASACFIVSVEDSMQSIQDWWNLEGRAFRGGSGVGVNLSRLRGEGEGYAGGGHAGGPVSYMAVADSIAGLVHSGGRTRRPAKMVILDADHPDIERFVWCKNTEEHKARVLQSAGYDTGMGGDAASNVLYQNANISVRFTDAQMQASLRQDPWTLNPVKDNTAKPKTVQGLLRQVAEAAWECADPGVQFTDNINRWHSIPHSGPIRASNPCAEFLSVDNSACNLASINLLKFLDDEDHFDAQRFVRAAEIFIIAQDAMVDKAEYISEAVAANSHRQRQLGLGYTNLGAMLMVLGIAYDSDAARQIAALITALMHGAAMRASAQLAGTIGTYEDWDMNQDAHKKVVSMRKHAVDELIDSTSDEDPFIKSLAFQVNEVWENMEEMVAETGLRNSHMTCIAPTGTISLLMQADTTGIEPEFALTKMKTLAGGGHMQIINQSVERALKKLGYAKEQVDTIKEYIMQNGTAFGAPELSPEDLDVFATAVGDNCITPEAHVRMIGAVQPFLSGGVSKTVNLPNSASIEDIEKIYTMAWQLGVKCISVYRDGSKVYQPLNTQKDAEEPPMRAAERYRLPAERPARTLSFRVGDHEGYMTCGEYPNGSLGEIFIKISKQGSLLSGLLDGLAMAVSVGLQYGVPLDTYVAKLTSTSFPPAGITSDPEIRMCTSLLDYIFRKLAVWYMSPEGRHNLGVYTVEERTDAVRAEMESSHGLQLHDELPMSGSISAASQTARDARGADMRSISSQRIMEHAPACSQCGNMMQPAGVCFVCLTCGTTSGCS